MRLFQIFFFLICFYATPLLAQTKILAQVNEDIISELDLKNRLDFIETTGQIKSETKQIKDKLLKQMIDEKLKLQFAQKANVTISDEELTNAIKMTLKQNGLDYDDVVKMIKKNNLPLSVLQEQIKSDILYIRTIKKQEHVNVSDAEIDAKMAEISNQLNQTQFLISEIVLPINDPDKEDEVYGQAMQLIIEMQQGASFEELAAKHSKAPSSAKGGLVGWVGEKSLSETELDELNYIPTGDITSPIKVENTYKIYVLRSKKKPENIEKSQTAVHLTQLFMPHSFTETKRKQVLAEVNMTKGSCQQFLDVSKKLETTPRMDLGVLSLSDLPPQIQSVLNRTPVLEPTKPLTIAEGALVFMMCKKESVSILPAKENIKQQIEAVKLEAMAQRKLKEIRRNAVVEMR